MVLQGVFKQDLEGDLLSCSGQVRSRSGLVQVWFSLQPKFNSFELDSEVGRLVITRLIVDRNKLEILIWNYGVGLTQSYKLDQSLYYEDLLKVPLIMFYFNLIPLSLFSCDSISTPIHVRPSIEVIIFTLYRSPRVLWERDLCLCQSTLGGDL